MKSLFSKCGKFKRVETWYLFKVLKEILATKLGQMTIIHIFMFDAKINWVPSLNSGALSGLRQFLTTESPSKMMKNAFYFTSKALSVLKIFKFLSWLWSCIKTVWLQR